VELGRILWKEGYTVQLYVQGAKSGIQCELCGRWYHYSCGCVKAQGAEREKWNCKSVGLKSENATGETAKRDATN